MARWTGPARLEEVPDELKEDETTGALRLVVNKAARKHDELASAEETVVPVHSAPPACPPVGVPGVLTRLGCALYAVCRVCLPAGG